MLLRLRWLVLGMVIAVGGGVVVVGRLVRLREQLTPDNVRRMAATVTADSLAWAASRLQGSTTPQG